MNQGVVSVLCVRLLRELLGPAGLVGGALPRLMSTGRLHVFLCDHATLLLDAWGTQRVTCGAAAPAWLLLFYTGPPSSALAVQSFASASFDKGNKNLLGTDGGVGGVLPRLTTTDRLPVSPTKTGTMPGYFATFFATCRSCKKKRSTYTCTTAQIICAHAAVRVALLVVRLSKETF